MSAMTVLLGASDASAAGAPTPDSTYTVAPISGDACPVFGSTDNSGNLYALTCDRSKLVRYDKDGKNPVNFAIPASIATHCNGPVGANTFGIPCDVAPSPDGTYLYVAQGNNPPIRLDKSGNTYTIDANWSLQKFNAGNKLWSPSGRELATDGHGDIYLSNGSYWVSNDIAAPSQIVKYSPDGTWLTSFGDYGLGAGQFNSNQDIAVSRDGRRVFVAENCGTQCDDAKPDYQPSRVTRFDYSDNGQYKYTSVLSTVGPYRGDPYPDCDAPGAVHSGYSMSLDLFDNLYVGSVSCGYIQKFTTNADPTKDVFVGTIAKYVDGSTRVRNHQLSVDWSGRVYASEWGYVLTPKNLPALPATPLAALPPLPAPDSQAPVVANVALPATTTTQDVAVTITASDNVAVTEMRLANEDGSYGPWQPYTSAVTWHLSNGYSVKGVFVQVRDMAGNISNTTYRTTGYIAPPAAGQAPAPVPSNDVAAPVISSATAPSVTATRNITITVAATDDVGVASIRFANEDGNWSPWRVFAGANAWTITDGYVNKLIFVEVRDAAGNESSSVQVKTRYAVDAPPPADNPNAPADNTAPTLTKIDLPAQTTSQNVSVAITASDNVAVSQVRFANEDGTWTNWQAYAASKTWTLSANYGGKAVIAQVRDAAGNESMNAIARTSFVQTIAGPPDAADPVLTAVTLPVTVPSSKATVHITASDDIGVTQVRLANEDGNWGAWQPIGNGDVLQTLTAGNTYKVVFAQVRDASGRESNTLYARTLVQP